MKKISPILQMNQTECGLCVATMLMEYYGVRINIYDISTKFVVGRDGVSIRDLKDIFATYQFRTGVFEAKNSLSKLNINLLPCIIYKKQGHFVVLEKVSKESATILDPAIGRIKIGKNELDNEYSRILISIAPKENFKKVNTRGSEYKIILEAVTSNVKSIFNVIVSTIFVYAITLLLPILLKIIVDRFLKEGEMDSYAKILSVMIISSSFIYLFINKVKLKTGVALSITIDKFLSIKVIDKLFKNKYEYFINRTSSDIQYRLALLKNLKAMISNVVIQTFLDLGTMLLIFIYMLRVRATYAVFLLFFTIFVILFSYIIKDKMLMLKNKELADDTHLQLLQYDIFRSIFDVKVLALSDEKKNIWRKKFDKYITSHSRSQNFLSNYHNLLSYITLYIPVFIPLIGIILSNRTKINEIGTIISLQSMTGIYINGLISISQLSDNLTTLKAYLSRIQDILLQDDEKSGGDEINFTGNIVVKNLSFRYPGAKYNTLNNLNFTIKRGEHIAIVGESASGKSTLFYILLGIYDTYEGSVEYENINLRELNKDRLREQIGVVPQNPLLFSGSIRDNITSDQNIDDDVLYSVLEKVSLLDFIKSLPMGLNTIISENGSNLSGGQKQRLALARAIINHKNVLILDEATSSLDNITESSIVSYLNHDLKTKIVIAHRLNTVKKCDRIIVLKNGEICEIGSHVELMRRKNEYYKMYNEEF